VLDTCSRATFIASAMYVSYLHCVHEKVVHFSNISSQSQPVD